MPTEVQDRLLRVMDQGVVQRPGEAAGRPADVRFIAAAAKGFTADARLRPALIERFSFTVVVPPLRDRPGDLEPLTAHLLAGIAAGLSRETPAMDAAALATLMRHPWPGNVRQLRQVLERACIAAIGGTIRVGDLPEGIRDPTADREAALGPILTLAEVERTHVLAVMERMAGNKKAAAEALGIDRSTLYAKLKTYGVQDR
jgi:two-component system response regulator HydG